MLHLWLLQAGDQKQVSERAACWITSTHSDCRSTTGAVRGTLAGADRAATVVAIGRISFSPNSWPLVMPAVATVVLSIWLRSTSERGHTLRARSSFSES